MRRIFRRPKKDIAPQFRANEQIRVPEVRVIDETGKNLGIIKTTEAIALAHERGLDLVEVSPKAAPPIAKFLDFGRFKYQKEKEARKQKAGAKKVEVKGVRLSTRIGEHDFGVRKNQAIKFLQAGDKVQIEIILRGRERQHASLAETVVKKFVSLISTEMAVKIEQPLSYLGGKMNMTISKS